MTNWKQFLADKNPPGLAKIQIPVSLISTIVSYLVGMPTLFRFSHNDFFVLISRDEYWGIVARTQEAFARIVQPKT
jgi:hypothetical protein